jgi:hypothetical protein
MQDKFVWKATIKFGGSAEEFNHLAEALENLPVEIEISEWVDIPHHLAGCQPLPLDVLLSEARIKKLTEGLPRMQIKFITDIAGGIRTPHLHLRDEVVLLDRAKFKTFVGQIAQELAERRAETVKDYIDVMDPVGRLAATPIEIP